MHDAVVVPPARNSLAFLSTAVRARQPAMAPRDWPAAAEHCASSVPECFRFDLGSVSIFMNGEKTLLGGAKPPQEAELRYGDAQGAGGRVLVNRSLETVPSRLTEDDVSLTQEQWTRCAAPACSCVAPARAFGACFAAQASAPAARAQASARCSKR